MSAPPTTVVTARRGALEQLNEVWRYRELLAGLVRKELKVKYKNSTLGFVWSMLNPAMYLVIFYVVFQLVLRAGIPFYAIFLLSGLLVWNLFATAVSSASTSITLNASLVNKVYFPRAILPLASVGAALVHFFLQCVVLLGALALFRYSVALSWLPMLVPALVVLLLLSAALAVTVACVNVYARDTQHLLELALLAWFWLTPIVYQYEIIADRLGAGPLPSWLALVNPVTPIVLVFQRTLYATVSATTEGAPAGIGRMGGGEGLIRILPDASVLWYGRNLVIIGFVSAVLLVLALRLFARVEGNFAEEL